MRLLSIQIEEEQIAKLIARSLVAFVVTLVILAAMEIVVRAVVLPSWRDLTQTPFEFHPIYRTFQKPNLEIRRFNPHNYDVINHTNRFGFRDRDEGFEQDLAGLWILGMSNSYGGFVEDEKIYASRLQADYGYTNALLASEGHQLIDQVSVMRHLAGQGYKPRAVILELTLYNVLGSTSGLAGLLAKPLAANDGEAVSHNAATESAHRQISTRLRDMYEQIATLDFVGLKSRLLNNSALYVYAKVLINDLPILRDWALRVGLRTDAATAVPIPIAMLDKSGPTSNKSVESLADDVKEIDRWIASQFEVPFGVVLIPSPQQRNREWLERYARSQNADPDALDPARPYNLLADGLRRRGVHTLTLGDVLGTSDPPLNFPDDGHLTAQGHALLADALAQWLKFDLSLSPDNQ